ncbi:sensor histidine kinase [Dactylosporangium sp. CA-139066]|uniref:sensor histidine kinase n=1 Tax=Dactylosporangium sp. CA-139066 TaxID=3239930 RepID=UPI003D8E0BAC
MRIDLTIALIVGVVVLVTTHGAPTTGPLEPAALTALVVACAALVLRRHHALAAFLTSSIAAEVYLVLNHSGTNGALILAAPLYALYTVAESQSRRRALTIGVLAVSAFAGLHMLAKPSSWLGAENLALAALGALAVAAGDGARSRREYLAEVESRAHRAELDREAEALRRVTEERLRIARDLHDAVGHQLALINVQSGVAAHLLESQPPRAREALSHVRAASRTALSELRDTIGLLRRPDDDPPPLDPLPGLAGLPDLVAAFRRSSHPPSPLPSPPVAARPAAPQAAAGSPEPPSAGAVAAPPAPASVPPAAGHAVAAPRGPIPAPVSATLSVGPHAAVPAAASASLAPLVSPQWERAEVPARPDLADRLVTVETVVTDSADAMVVPTAVDLTAYRVIQECLTNACKHAALAPVHVRLRYTPESLELRVDNAPPSGPPTAARMEAGATGHGLVGMRERVEALGGLLVAGPRPDGGFRVTAILPRSVRSAPLPDTGHRPPRADDPRTRQGSVSVRLWGALLRPAAIGRAWRLLGARFRPRWTATAQPPREVSE